MDQGNQNFQIYNTVIWYIKVVIASLNHLWYNKQLLVRSWQNVHYSFQRKILHNLHNKVRAIHDYKNYEIPLQNQILSQFIINDLSNIIYFSGEYAAKSITCLFVVRSSISILSFEVPTGWRPQWR